MDFQMKHEIKGRIRVHVCQERMTFAQADSVSYYLQCMEGITGVKVYEKTADIVIRYEGEREKVLLALRGYRYGTEEIPEAFRTYSGSAFHSAYQERLLVCTMLHAGKRFFLPYGVRAVITALKSIKYIYKGLSSILRGKPDVCVLDAAAIGVSVCRGEMDTAGNVMFLLGIGEILEEWTHKKSVGDLARSMALPISRVWCLRDGQEVLIPAREVAVGDSVMVRLGNVIPFDGVVREGEAMVNQSSMTGESAPVRKAKDDYVYAGTVLEEGEILLQVRECSGSTRFEKIVTMIEESEKLKSAVESRAEHLADRLVPITLLGTGLVWALTGNFTKALPVLMVDFSCALKLSIPVTVLSAIREANARRITVKGGKYLEAVSEARTIVFDKTGTLTKAKPKVKAVYTFCEEDEREMLRLAACLEEHFPHSMAKAVVAAAAESGLEHEETHTKVEYIVAHGIISSVEDREVMIGSYHFIFEDMGCRIPEGQAEVFASLPEEYSHLYLAIDRVLSAVVCIEDPLREEAGEVIRALKDAGFRKVVMMTGDSRHAADAAARQIGVDEYYAEVLPEDKAEFIRKEKENGRKVVMIGDGINDSPALSAADAGIAISDGAELAREVADITIAADDLYEIVMLKHLSDRLMKRIQNHYRAIIGVNAALIVLGVSGAILPATSALLHNASTLAITLRGTRNLLK